MTETPERIANVSGSPLSVARLYGRCTFNGRAYTYDPDTDTLVRDDVLEVERMAEIHKKRAGRVKAALDHERQQGTLFDGGGE